jgi:hypothetical protein
MNTFARWFTVFTEFERGWGSKVFHVEGHATKEAATLSEIKCNSKNTGSHAPDYYIQAEVSTDLNWLKHKDYIDLRQSEEI